VSRGLHRREVVKALLKDRGGLLVVAGLGSSAWDCAAAGCCASTRLCFPTGASPGSST